MQSYYDAIKHFYQSNEVALNWHVMKDYVGVVVNVSPNLDRPYTYEEIQKMLEKCDERKRVIVLLLASTGMRRGAIPELKVGDLKWIDKYDQIYEIQVYAGFPESYTIWSSSECARSINSYLDYRRRSSEEITEDSYLIRKQFNKEDPANRINGSRPNDPPEKHKISMATLETTLYHLVYDAGIRNYQDKKKRVGDRHKNMAAHSYRKFFENKCLESGVDPFYVSILMGHRSKGIGIERHYYRSDSINGEYSLLELYAKKAMPYLTISEESRLRLKNRELEMRMAEDERRFKAALDQTQSMNHDSITALSEQLLKMQKEIEELKKGKGQS